jgi:hypothetical protein
VTAGEAREPDAYRDCSNRLLDRKLLGSATMFRRHLASAKGCSLRV